MRMSFVNYRLAIPLLVLLALPLFASASTFPRPLSQGQSGPDVVALQQYLKHHGYLVGWKATGLYGAATTQAVAQFQKANGLEAVGSRRFQPPRAVLEFD